MLANIFLLLLVLGAASVMAITGTHLRSSPSNHQLIAKNETSQGRRFLSQEVFISYEPYTTVTDQAAMDLDQMALETQLLRGTDISRQNALKIYTQGAFSNPYAELTLLQPLPENYTPVGIPVVPKGTQVVGTDMLGGEAVGYTVMDAMAGDTVLSVQYHVSPIQDSLTNCHVGGNPDPVTDGCFAGNGTIKIALTFGDAFSLTDLSYIYDPLQSNKNARTLQGFATRAQAEMYNCPGCPYRTYDRFYDYYGAFDYANQWILAAFNQGATNFARGNAQFSNITLEGSSAAIRVATAYMNVWMYVIARMEKAVDDCAEGCTKEDNCNRNETVLHTHPWDEAVAYYTGSLPKATGRGGYLLYSLAQKSCRVMGTCLIAGSRAGQARTNSRVMKSFREGQFYLHTGQCAEASISMRRIRTYLKIPLVQSVLRFAFKLDVMNDTREETKAEGATFAATILPLVHECSQEDAAVIYDNMQIGSSTRPDFTVVKAALERNYYCMGMSCEDIGGILDALNENYMEGAWPCVDFEGGINATAIFPPANNYTSVTTTTTSDISGGNSSVSIARDPVRRE